MGEERRKLSRRALVVDAGKFVLGAAVGAGVLAAGSGPMQARVEAAPQWPYPYKPLDAEEVRKKGHLGYYQAA